MKPPFGAIVGTADSVADDLWEMFNPQITDALVQELFENLDIANLAQPGASANSEEARAKLMALMGPIWKAGFCAALKAVSHGLVKPVTSQGDN